MIAAAPQTAIENYLNTILQSSEDVFLVEVKVNVGNRIVVLLDADSGITIEKCVQINRALYKQIEEDSLFADGNFSLEVSSPGVDEPLKLHRQYKKNIGRTIEIVFNDESKKQGKLITVNENDIIIEEKDSKGKKNKGNVRAGIEANETPVSATNKQTTILFNQIRHTTVLVTF